MNAEQTSDTVVATPKPLTRDERVAREISKEHQLRALAKAAWGYKDLLEIFGLGLAHRLRTNPFGERIGKNYFTKHFHAGKRNPAGSKLLRRFIRQNSKEAVFERKAYATLTGRQYDHLNNPEQ
jgi:hypothetical protein